MVKIAGNIDKFYERALLIRLVEQKLLALFSEGKLFGTVHTCIGQEFTGVAVADALEDGDFIFSNHRCHGHYIARTDDVEGLIAEIMGKKTGICGGKGGSQHICANRVFSNGVQGGIMPVSAGMAFAENLKQTDNIGIVFIGDGTLGEGLTYETLNIISLWNIPLLIVQENNYFAQSTPQEQNLAGDICSRARAFGIETAYSNTWQPEELITDIADSVQKVRENQRPLFHRVDTYRLMAHSKGDDPRDPKIINEYWNKDPLCVYTSKNKQKVEDVEKQFNARINLAVECAERADYTTEDDSFDSFISKKCEWQITEQKNNERVAVILYEAFKRNMAENEKIFLIGEDIEGPYGGAFKVTKDLSDLYPKRVRNTPISEAAIVGLGNGLALNGMIPVCEIMFGDFLTLAFDQFLNHASKFRYMYNKQVTLPLIVRTPMGGRRGYGPTHSQSIEKHFLGMPDISIFAINELYCPGKFYDTLFRNIKQPSLVIENKLLYGKKLLKEILYGYILEHSDELYPTARLCPRADHDLTIVCYGGMVPYVINAVNELFEKHDIICEIIVPQQLYPFNIWPVAESVSKSGRLFIVEEGINFASLSSEIISEIMEVYPGILKQTRRLASPNHPIPSCGPLEQSILPNEKHIVSSVLELISG